MPQKPDYDAAKLVPRARVLRADATPAERALWDMVRGGKMGVRFRRQQPVGPYIVDFYCAEAGLVVELDGRGHADQVDYDQRRDAWLAGKGLTVLRFRNEEVLQRPHDVYRAIMTALRAHPHPGASRHPSPSRGEGKKG
jgi:very-short-patch-repair endonuclease